MLNTQIPSGLQALMQAAQILQQQASPSAPGPQGQQPTVAKQVEQAAAQQAPMAMPDMQAVGQQAGIAGQMMAQRQQQQQQMAQNPQAVAQMAAQMLRQGVGSLPANMQFREGGIIGYAGEEGSEVRLQPIPDRELAEMEDEDARERRRRSMFRDLEPEPLPVIERGEPREPRRPPPVDAAGQRMDAALGRAYRSAPTPRERPVGLAQIVEEQRPIPSALQRLREAGSFEKYAEGARGPRQDLAAVLESEFQRGAEAGAEPRPAPEAPPKRESPAERPQARPEPAPVAAPSGIAAVAPRERPTLQGILNAVPEDKAAAEEAKKREEINARMLAMRRSQPDLAAEGIAALGRSEAERKRLLDLQRSEDSLNSFIRLGQALRTGGDQYMAYSAGMKARDEADRVATLAGEEAVLKLKQAQQARQMGDLEMEKKFLDEAAGFRKEAQKARMEQAKAEATLAGTTYQTDVQASTAAANRAQDLQIKLMELKQKAEADNNIKLSNQITLASQRLAAAQRNIAATLEKEFPDYATLVRLQGVGGNLSDSQKKSIQDYQRRARQLEASTLAPIEGILAKLSKDAGVEIPQAAAPSAPGVDFSKLPK